MNDHRTEAADETRMNLSLPFYGGERQRKAADMWGATTDALQQLVLLVDETGAIRRCNEAVNGWRIGFSDRIAGMSWHKLLHPHCKDPDCPLLAAWDAARKKIERGESHQCTVQDPPGGKTLQLVFQSPNPDTPGTMSPGTVFAIIVIEDRTRSCNIENQLSLIKAELQLLFDAVPHILMRLSTKGMVLDWSARLVSGETLPLRLEKGHFIHYVFPVDLVNQFIKAMAQCTEAGKIVKIQYTLPTPQGNLLFDAGFLPFGDDEIIVLSRDITEKIRLENIAESVQMMSNIGYIFSGIRHEIGNPINSIKMTMSVLKNNIGNYSQEKIMEYADRVLNEIQRVEYLLTSLKNFNMYENLVPKPLSLLSFIDRLMPLIEEDFKRRGICIETDIRTREDSALADARALQQVLLNLLSNAADSFLDPDKNPTIVIGLERKGRSLELTIRDNGVGMSPYQLENLFKPFFTSKPHGTGLGLVIVKKLMIQMNGEIEIESRTDEGTKVRLILQTAENG